MADQSEAKVTKGDGYAVSSLGDLGEGWGFRKVRKELGVTAFGVNAIVMPPGYESGRHYHQEQEELYFVHQGRLEINLDGEKYELAPGGLAWVEGKVVRSLKNLSDDEDAIYVCVGGKDGYIGRDGRLPEGETDPRGPIKGNS
jgi:quercetin dioxygenase-like cupin family protein